MIEIKEISLDSKRDKKKFFKFLIDLYKGNEHAAPNLYMDEMAEFDPKVNDAFRFADCRMFLAYKDGKIAGRIAGIWHRGVNEKNNVKQLRFTRFDV
ncbi:MAG: N-acetyltransferase, partial [Clostridia bacterium]|nr:N-acetyltransferase [Clostridia bacterium]